MSGLGGLAASWLRVLANFSDERRLGGVDLAGEGGYASAPGSSKGRSPSWETALRALQIARPAATGLARPGCWLGPWRVVRIAGAEGVCDALADSLELLVEEGHDAG